VAPTAYAETLRDLGRGEEALGIFAETMQRFPNNEVAPNAYAETLRDLGRGEEALRVFAETMQRFPHSAVTRNAYAHLLAERREFTEVERLLLSAAKRSETREDWIASHILAMAWLKAGRVEDALAEFERGARFCSVPNEKRYFITGQSIALLAARRADEAAQKLQDIAKDSRLPREEATNVTLFHVHALAEAGRPKTARDILESAKIIDFAAAKQKRLAAALNERYGLSSGIPASAMNAERLNEDIATLEFELARPNLRKSLVRRAA
jgi:tetratricopeptide (TPR) repeat protein